MKTRHSRQRFWSGFGPRGRLVGHEASWHGGPSSWGSESAATWMIYVTALGASLVSLLAGSPMISVAILTVPVTWALRDTLFTWKSGISLLLLLLLLVPSRVYRLPFATAFDADPYRIMLLLLAVIWVVSSFTTHTVLIRATYLDAAVVVFIAAVGLSYMANLVLFAEPSEFAMMVKSMAFLVSLPLTMYLIVSTITDSRDALRLIDMVLIVAGIAGAMAVVERITQYNLFQHLDEFVPVLQYIIPAEQLEPIFRGAVRAAGPTAHPIAFATMLSMLLPLAIARTLEGGSRQMSVVFGGCCAGMGIGIFLALSRTGVVGLTVAGAVVLLGFPRWRGILLASVVALLGAVHLVFRGVIGTLIEFFTPSYVMSQEVGNQNGRFSDYAPAVTQILGRFWFGRGFNTFSPDRYAFLDNQYLKFLLEVGIVGTLAFLFLVARATVVPFSRGDRMGGEYGAVLIGIAAAAAVFGVTSATFDTMGFPQVAYLFFALAGLGAVIMNDPQRDAGASS